MIELLIATSIFSIIILSVYSAFQTGILTSDRIDSASAVFQTARIVLNRMESDLRNSFVYKPDEFGFQGDKQKMAFFNLLDSFSEGKSYLDVCRIKYELVDKGLKRICYKGVDALKKETGVAGEDLLYDIKNISFEYASSLNNPDKPYEWKASWPPDDSQKNNLPLAVKIKLSLIEKNRRQKEQGNTIEFNKVIPLPLLESATPPSSGGASGG